MRNYWIARLVTASILAILVGSFATDRAGLVPVAICAILLQFSMLNVAVYYLVHRSEDDGKDRQFIVDTLIHIFVVFLLLVVVGVGVAF